MINWTATKEETITISKIVKRYIEMFPKDGINVLSLNMDIAACHCNGCPLRLDDLLAADDFNFVHDVSGIRNSINRKTAQLMNCFVPRFAKPEGK